MLLRGPISHTSTQYMDFVEIFNISLSLPAIYFAHFNPVLPGEGCSAPPLKFFAHNSERE